MSITDKFQRLQEEIEKITAREERQLQKNYVEALAALRLTLAKAFENWETGGQLFFEELTRYNRLEKFFDQLKAPMEELTASNRIITLALLRRVYEDSFNETRSIIETAANRKIRGIMKPEIIKAAIHNPISGLTLNERLSKNRADVILKLRENITQGLQRGETYRTMAARAKTTLENDAVKSMRVMRTEGHRIMETAKDDSLKNAGSQGVKMRKRWVSSRDSRVRDSHKHMDGQTVDYDKDFYNRKTGGRGPGPGRMGNAADDINCRCIFVIEID